MYHDIDWDGPLPDGEDQESVEVPAIPVPLEDDDLREFLHTVCLTAPSDDYGHNLYNHALQFVKNKLLAYFDVI